MAIRSRRSRKKEKHRFVLFAIVLVLILAVALFIMYNRRVKTRDDRRLNDLKQMQTVLNYHYELYNEYPKTEQFTCFHDATKLFEGLVPWLVALPVDPKNGESPTDVKDACYNYRSDDGKNYKIRAVLEKNVFSMEQDGGVSAEWYEIFTTNAADW